MNNPKPVNPMPEAVRGHVDVTFTRTALDRFAHAYPRFILVGLAATFLWSYWPILGTMAHKWSSDPQYSQAFLVPVFSAALLWMRWKAFAQKKECLDSLHLQWLGAFVLAAGVAMRLLGGHFYVDWFEAISLLPTLAGAALLLGGWRALRLSWLAIGFLVFMIPLPQRAETTLSQPLRRVATLASTYTLQTLGLPALSEGNVILVNEARIRVIEACGGLGMLLVFFALTTGVAIFLRRNLWEKSAIVVSAVPIAVIANVIRISVTAILLDIGWGKLAHLVFHDLAGWLMMPTALVILWIELQVLSRLVIESAPASPLGIEIAPLPPLETATATAGSKSRPGSVPVLRDAPQPTSP
jgi:exosortase